MIETLLQPFAFPFMQKAFLVTLSVAAPMALLSCIMVLRGWSLMGDAIAHAVLPGIVLSWILGLPLALGAFAAGFVCAIAVGWLNDNSRVKEDTVMGIVFSGMFALGLVMYVAIQPGIHLDHILFGDMLGTTWGDVAGSALIGSAVALALFLKRQDLMAAAFDPQHARAIGLPAGLLHYGLLAAISLTVVAALQAVGIILSIALLVAPGAIAFLWVRRFGTMLALALGITTVACVTGIYLSFFLNSAPAPTIVLVLTAGFVFSFVATARAGRTRGEVEHR
jgi:manganese/iron transport system permease protein